MTGYAQSHTVQLCSDAVKTISGHQGQANKWLLYLAQRLYISISFILLKLKSCFTDVSKTINVPKV